MDVNGRGEWRRWMGSGGEGEEGVSIGRRCCQSGIGICKGKEARI